MLAQVSFHGEGRLMVGADNASGERSVPREDDRRRSREQFPPGLRQAAVFVVGSTPVAFSGRKVTFGEVV
jgi:hypothetical protein